MSQDSLRGQAVLPKKSASKPALTHFLSFPIGHHANLRTHISTFTSALLASEPAITGLDPSIIVQPRRLHFTIGTLSLSRPSESSLAAKPIGAAITSAGTLERASAVLNLLRLRILDVLAGQPLRVELESIDVLQPDRRKPGMAHVLVLCPNLTTEDGKRLVAVSDMIRDAFAQEKLLIDAKQSLKLHCTVLNTRYRRPRPKNARVSFSYTELQASPALTFFTGSDETPSSHTATTPDARVPQSVPSSPASRSSIPPAGWTKQRGSFSHEIPVSFGSYTVDELQLCQMGSWGLEGEYVADATCLIIP